MKKLSFKWKLFLIANYVQLVAFLLLFITVLLYLVSYTSFYNEETLLRQVLVLFVLLLIALNSSLNIHTLYRYFPDLAMPARSKIFLRVSGIINILIHAGLLYLYFLGFREAYQDRFEKDQIGIIILCGFFLLWLLELYILIVQFQVFSYLSRNNKKKMSTLIDSIGDVHT
jgi:hypothetical protein